MPIRSELSKLKVGDEALLLTPSRGVIIDTIRSIDYTEGPDYPRACVMEGSGYFAIATEVYENLPERKAQVHPDHLHDYIEGTNLFTAEEMKI